MVPDGGRWSCEQERSWEILMLHHVVKNHVIRCFVSFSR